ncbi:GNAT family N-acetyltransferase [Lutimonas sp.]|uniref:GNAT family N-acetyltransferase n=1 Tax=Lutimonas sp. TaxID=1872403 RepID=UPI003D9BCA94
MMNLQFKRASPEELSDALLFFKLASQSLGKKNLSQWSYWADPPQEKIIWVQEGFDNNEFYFVLNQDNRKVAMFRLLKTDTLYWENKGLEKSVRYVHSLVVPPEFSGLGIGKTVLLKIIEDLRSQGIKKFRLDCDGSNTKLCQYYESYGFKKVGEKSTNFALNNLYEMSL